MATKTSPATIMQLADRTTAEGLKFVHARRITESLWAVGEMYHAGAIDHAEFTRSNRLLWDAAAARGVVADVKRNLRNV